MYLCYWHPVNHKLWFEVYRDMPIFTKQAWSIPYHLRLITEYGGGIWAKVDMALAYPRGLILIIAAILLALYVISVCA